MSSVKKEEQQRLQQLPDFSLDELQSMWLTHKEAITAKSVLAAFENVAFDAEGTQIRAYVPHERIQEVLQNNGFLVNISDRFKQDDVDYVIVVDKDRFPDYDDGEGEALKKTLTEMEKYKLIVEKNPAIERLRQVLDLHLDK